MTLRIGTRRSPLALAQSRLVAAALEQSGAGPVELVEISTLGDVSRQPLSQLGGTGIFVSALRDALLAGEVDIAVHSLKDLPVATADGLVLGAVPVREDPRDVVVGRDGRSLAGLPDGARIGTGSPRRAAQLRALGRGFDIVDVRGNVETRVGYVAAGDLDAVVLARAGLARLGRLDVVTEVLDPLEMLPAPGQGALAVECRADRADVIAILAPLDDPGTRVAVNAERALLARTEAGCSAPVGALAEVVHDGFSGPEIYLRAVVGTTDGDFVRRLSITGPLADPIGLGHQLADRLLAEGADGLWGVRVT
jgi:hydroxymethylbilane synthase